MQELTTFFSHHLLLSLAAAAIFVLIVIIETIRAKRNVFNVTPTQAIQLINRENAVVLDIRPKDAYRLGHIIDAISFTTQEITGTSKKLEKFKIRPIIIVATVGSESQKIAALLLKRGYNAYSLTGGMRAWNEGQLPLIKESSKDG